jgi:uncharacterized RDD family membrane protein YckC
MIIEHSRLDSALGVQTPEGIEYYLYPAGFAVRACALVIDSLIQGALTFIFIIAAGFSGRAMGLWFSFILAFVINWFYHSAFDIFNRGQSPGKKMMGLRVLKGDGSPVSLGASFLRNLLRFADSFMFLYLIALICMLVSPGFRRLGDWVADTLVVYADKAKSRFVSPALRRSGMPWLSDFPVVSPSRCLDYEEKQAILTFARRYPLLGKARSDEIAGMWAEELYPFELHSTELQSGGSEASASAILLGIARTIGGG